MLLTQHRSPRGEQESKSCLLLDHRDANGILPLAGPARKAGDSKPSPVRSREVRIGRRMPKKYFGPVIRKTNKYACACLSVYINNQKKSEESIMKNVKRMAAVLLMAATVVSLSACGGASGSGTLKVAMECSYAPYNWTQPDSSNGAVQIDGSKDYAYGYDVMMAKKIAESMGKKLVVVKLDWDSLVPAVQSGKVDCVIAGQSITSERLQSVDFSEPYYYATMVTLVKKDGKYASAKSIKDLSGATVTSQLSTIWYDKCCPQIPGANVLPAQESAPAMLVALEAGKCDAVVTDQPTGKAALVAYPDMVMLDFAGTAGDYQVSDEDVNIGVSMKKGNTALKDSVNKVLKTMTKSDFSKMMDDAIKVQPLNTAK